MKIEIDIDEYEYLVESKTMLLLLRKYLKSAKNPSIEVIKLMLLLESEGK